MALELADSNGIGFGVWALVKIIKANTLVLTLAQLEK